MASVGAGSTAAWTGGADSWILDCATAFRTAGAVFFAFGFGAAFTIFRATFFAAFTRTGGFLAVGAAAACWRFAGATVFVFFAGAFFALSRCQRFFCAAAMRFRAAALNRFLPVVFGSVLAVAVEMDRLEPPWPNSAWNLSNGSFDPVPLQFVTHERHFEDAGVVNRGGL